MIEKINKCLATRYLKDKMFRIAPPDTQIKYFQRLVNMANLPSTWASQDTKRVMDALFGQEELKKKFRKRR